MSIKSRIFSGLRQTIWFGGTTLAMAGVLYTVFPLWVAEMYFVNYFVHEMSHYFAGLFTGGKPKLPFFIPLGILVIGGTYVDPPNPTAGMITALIGPIVTGLVNAAMLAYMISIGFMPGVFFAAALLAMQIYSGTLGSDGRKFRRSRREAAYERADSESQTIPEPAFA